MNGNGFNGINNGFVNGNNHPFYSKNPFSLIAVIELVYLPWLFLKWDKKENNWHCPFSHLTTLLTSNFISRVDLKKLLHSWWRILWQKYIINYTNVSLEKLQLLKQKKTQPFTFKMGAIAGLEKDAENRGALIRKNREDEMRKLAIWMSHNLSPGHKSGVITATGTVLL